MLLGVISRISLATLSIGAGTPCQELQPKSPLLEFGHAFPNIESNLFGKALASQNIELCSYPWGGPKILGTPCLEGDELFSMASERSNFDGDPFHDFEIYLTRCTELD